jgi:hypothetical protein
LLDSGKIKVFAVISILLHVAFVLLFGKVTFSSSPPDKTIPLFFVTREASKAEIMQSTAAWPMPRRHEPPFPTEEALKRLDSDIMQWTQFGLPDSSHFSPKDTLIPQMKIAELAEKAYEGAPAEAFAQLPAESKPMPIADFALGPAFPEFSGID